MLNYIADFYCYELKLVIELDGYTHQFEEVQVKDEQKQAALEKLGLTVMRFQDSEIFKDMKNVLRVIEIYAIDFEENTPSSPSQEGS